MTWPWVALAVAVLASFSVWAFRRSSYHQGKADAFREVSDIWYLLTRLSVADTDARRDYTKRERTAAFTRLALCDPRVREAMWEGLREADAFWMRAGDLQSELAHPREEVLS